MESTFHFTLVLLMRPPFLPDGLQAAIALLAVTLNLFPEDLYLKKGGRGKVKDRRILHDHCWT